jgi:cytochrome b561
MQTQSGGYAAPQRAIHWIMALLILPMTVAGFVMIQQGLPRLVQDSLFLFHKNIGVLMLILAGLRVFIRLRNPAPRLSLQLPVWQRRMAAASHGLLYVLICLMPLSGYIRVRAGGFPIEVLDRFDVPTLVPRSDALAAVAKTVHEYGAYALAAALVLHIAAALYHGLILRDGTFGRIWPLRRV